MAGPRILILGGTTEARRLAEALSQRPDLEVMLSLAGRTAAPLPQPVPYRTGGFGGAEGLAQYMRAEGIGLLVDATHPFAARISGNAAMAAGMAAVPAIALRRGSWQPVEGDRWISVPGVAEAIAALGAARRRVFLAIGRQEAHQANSAPMHSYVVRSVDPVDPPLAVPDAVYIRDLGPFRLQDELHLMRQHAIEVVIAKNSGGSATYAKIEAARVLGLEVIMIERPADSGLPAFETPEAALAAILHLLSPEMKRGV